MKTNNLIFLFLGLLFWAACSPDVPPSESDTATSGSIRIAADDSYRLLTEAQLQTFHAIYGDATVTPKFETETEAIQDMIKDSVRFVIISRKLNANEMRYFDSVQIPPVVTKIAVDALAFIVHPDNKDTSLLYSDIEKILKGQISSWKDINPKSNLDKINVVFDNSKAGNIRYIKENLVRDGKFPSNCFAVNTNVDVINYVNKNKNAIGIIGVNWLSRNDSLTNRFRSDIKVLRISPKESKDREGSFYRPYQTYIADKSYPFIREVYIVSREARMGLGTGLCAFIAGDKGRRIVLKQGLVPGIMPSREVRIR